MENIFFFLSWNANTNTLFNKGKEENKTKGLIIKKRRWWSTSIGIRTGDEMEAVCGRIGIVFSKKNAGSALQVRIRKAVAQVM